MVRQDKRRPAKPGKTSPQDGQLGRPAPAPPCQRKSLTFFEPSSSDRDGQRTAFMLSLITTARLNDVDLYAWLADVLSCIADIPQNLHNLLPGNWYPTEDQPKAAGVVVFTECLPRTQFLSQISGFTTSAVFTLSASVNPADEVSDFSF